MKRQMLALLIVVSMLISGCWDRREINDLLIVVGTAHDVVDEQGQIMILHTSQISETSTPQESTGGQGPKTTTFWTVSGTGLTIRDGVNQQFRRAPKNLYYGQNRILIIGERAARYGLSPILDRAVRGRESRRSIYVAVTKGEARKILETEMPGNKGSGIALSSMFDLQAGTEDIFAVSVSDLTYAMSTGLTSPVAPVVAVVPQNSITAQDLKTPGDPLQTLQISGLAIFSTDGKLIDYFNKEESIGLLYVRNKIKNRVLNIDSPVGGPQETVSLGLVNSKSKTIVSLDEKGLPTFEIKVRSLYDVFEDLGNGKGLDEEQYFKGLAQSANLQIKKEIMAAVNQGQSMEADPFEFGEEFKRQHYKEWLKVKDQWKQIYPSVKVTVKCDSGLRNRGLEVKSPGAVKEF